MRVLHVDDEPHWRELTATFLERADDDIEVTGESSPETALERLSSESIDCVVSDYEMPEMDGVEFLRAARSEYPNLPFVLFTGQGSETVASEATTAGVTAYVEKGGAEVYQLLANQVEQGVARQRSEHRARVANDRLLSLYEQTDGFFVLDYDWTVLYWNRRISARTGRPSEDVLGEDFWTAFPGLVGTAVEENLREAMAYGESTEFEFYRDSEEYWLEVRAYPVDEGLFVHSRDITSEKTRERELRRRNRILESFANTVSHDFRNPLNIAEGELQLAQETGDFDRLDNVAKAHNRMRNLIDDLLQLAREEESDTSTVSLRETATDAWETVTSEETRLDVRDDARFEAHRSQLRRLFENLYWNAIDHGDATRVRVGTLDGDGFYVADDGDGIGVEDRDRVFDAGYSTSETGTGYGLHIVENVVEMHDWDVDVAEGATGGARFEIRADTSGDAAGTHDRKGRSGERESERL